MKAYSPIFESGQSFFDARFGALTLTALLALAGCETPPQPPETVVKPPVVIQQPAMRQINTVDMAQRAALRELVIMQDKLYRVTAPLLVHNASLCPHNARNLLGFSAKNMYSYSGEFVNSAQKDLGLGEELQIMGVMQGSAAAESGVQIGDKLVAINGTPVPKGQNAEHLASLILTSIIGDHNAINLTINRQGQELSMRVPLTHACAFVVEFGNTDEGNAYNDGHRVLVTRGLLNATGSDQELAYVLAIEMAHNALHHVKTKQAGAETVETINNLTKLHPEPSKIAATAMQKLSTPDLDIAADKRALYMLARAGFAIESAGQYWAQLAVQFPSSNPQSYGASHPMNANRMAAIEKVVTEIQAKQAANKPLVPDPPVPVRSNTVGH